ncbi:LPS translocon maturation chaperone LptM [Parasphingorhabdus sp.]|uniref:LPS translocon maturation chaperone LptM n=1 Tax=Parasphingorhabdus sp. TaxID=2709688 RepID=UPI0032EB6820
MKKIHSILLLVGATTVLAACGNRGALQPAKGEALPPPVYGEMKTPSGDDLLIPSSQAKPERSDELLRRSEKRQDDEFDLPPPG